MGNAKLAQVAIEGVEKASWAPLESGLCQVFARLCYEHVYGKEFEKYRRASAALTGLAFQAGGLAITEAQAGKKQPGDILYKVHGSGGYGHVGIVVDENRVAENSSTHIGRVRGALGYRTLAQFGSCDLVVRLTPPQDPKPASLIIGVSDGENVQYTRLQNAMLNDGAFSVNASELAKVLLPGTQTIREALDALGYSIQSEGNYLTDANDPRQYLIVGKK